MRRFKFILPAAVLIGGLTLPATVSFAKKEYTAKEKKACTYCHTAANSKELNKIGQCYAKEHKLDGCEAK
jgi:hypothetical protein